MTGRSCLYVRSQILEKRKEPRSDERLRDKLSRQEEMICLVSGFHFSLTQCLIGGQNKGGDAELLLLRRCG